jgi:DNA-directed RNA polymerase specialized sigma subunit
MIQESNDHFRTFASSLEGIIAGYGEREGTLFEVQKRQVEGLIALEEKFRQTLIDHYWGPSVYRMFVRYIRDDRKSILAARPYFRELQPTFAREISEALKARYAVGLYRFRLNYQFMRFVMAAKPWGQKSELVKLAEQIEKLRSEIVETNIPLAISRARIFWSRTQKSVLTYMDLVQIASEGLMAAVDKFVPPFRTVFRSVAIGRMTGNMIESYSETMIHFYPADARRIYRAHKLLGRNLDSVIDYEVLAEKVNENADEKHRVTSDELANLLAAASCVSMDSSSGDDDTVEVVSRFAAPESTRPDVQVEKADSMSHLYTACAKLSILEQKLLRLKGVSTPSIGTAGDQE